MKLSAKNSKSILLEIHQDIHDSAEQSLTIIFGEKQDSLTYPPGIELSENEILALKNIIPNEELKSALRKIIIDNSASVIFNLLNILDGTGDPKNTNKEWSGVKLVDRSEEPEGEHEEFLHDEFYATYWDWYEK